MRQMKVRRGAEKEKEYYPSGTVLLSPWWEAMLNFNFYTDGNVPADMNQS